MKISTTICAENEHQWVIRLQGSPEALSFVLSIVVWNVKECALNGNVPWQVSQATLIATTKLLTPPPLPPPPPPPPPPRPPPPPPPLLLL